MIDWRKDRYCIRILTLIYIITRLITNHSHLHARGLAIVPECPRIYSFCYWAYHERGQWPRRCYWIRKNLRSDTVCAPWAVGQTCFVQVCCAVHNVAIKDILYVEGDSLFVRRFILCLLGYETSFLWYFPSYPSCFLSPTDSTPSHCVSSHQLRCL